jgi:hypothetical protein
MQRRQQRREGRGRQDTLVPLAVEADPALCLPPAERVDVTPTALATSPIRKYSAMSRNLPLGRARLGEPGATDHADAHRVAHGWPRSVRAAAQHAPVGQEIDSRAVLDRHDAGDARGEVTGRVEADVLRTGQQQLAGRSRSSPS